MHQSIPDATAIQRRSYVLTIEDYKPGDAMAVASLTVPGRLQPAKFMGEPEVLEQLVAALDPAPVVHQVAALVQWAAGAMENAGSPDDADVARRIAAYLVGDIASPIKGGVDAPRMCVDGDCSSTNTRECQRCGKPWCVVHWSGNHPCGTRTRRELPPPIVPLPSPPPEPSYR